MQHRPDAYCAECGGACRDPWALASLTDKPLSLPPIFTGSGEPTWKPSRNGKRGPGR